MREEFIIKAKNWYKLHKEHVDKLVSLVDYYCEPTLPYDIRQPEVWKAGHWKWFLKEHYNHENK